MARPHGCPDDRFEERANDLGVETARVFVAGSEHRVAGELEVPEQGGSRRRQRTRFRELDRRAERFGRDIVMDFAVRERQRREAFRVASGEDLRHRTARVVRDEIDRVEGRRVTEGEHRVGKTGQGKVLVGARRAVTVQGKIERNVTAVARKLVDHVPPEVGIRGDAMHEQGRRAFANVDAADVTSRGRHEQPVCFEALIGHFQVSSVGDSRKPASARRLNRR